MSDETGLKFKSATELLNVLFEQDLADEEKYDPEVVELAKQHLGQTSLDRLANALLELAKTRAEVDQS
jgi:hypothetical protein